MASRSTVEGPKFKIILIGDGGVGKSTFLKRHLTGEFKKLYEPTTGCDVLPLKFSTTRGAVHFDVFDTAGQEKVGRASLATKNYQDADGAIIMADVTSRITFSNVPEWYKGLMRARNGIPVVVVGNKNDVKERKVKTVRFPKMKILAYYDVSVKANYNVDKPFLALASFLFKDQNLEFVQTPALLPPEMVISPEHLAQLEQEMANLQLEGPALPDEDDDDDL